MVAKRHGAHGAINRSGNNRKINRGGEAAARRGNWGSAYCIGRHIIINQSNQSLALVSLNQKRITRPCFRASGVINIRRIASPSNQCLMRGARELPLAPLLIR